MRILRLPLPPLFYLKSPDFGQQTASCLFYDRRLFAFQYAFYGVRSLAQAKIFDSKSVMLMATTEATQVASV